ncbi:hypothetical protein CG747_42600 [Streptomyces sp. CB02959]|nr:hypothetical protein CG747_42600 [Streptomyces sp. CB02959]
MAGAPGDEQAANGRGNRREPSWAEDKVEHTRCDQKRDQCDQLKTGHLRGPDGGVVMEVSLRFVRPAFSRGRI